MDELSYNLGINKVFLTMTNNLVQGKKILIHLTEESKQTKNPTFAWQKLL